MGGFGLKNRGAIVFYQDGQEIIIKDGDYVELETKLGNIKDMVTSIDTWELGELHFKEYASIDIHYVQCVTKVIPRGWER